MDIFSIITLVGGLAFFLYGMTIMSSGLEKIAGGKMEHLLRKVASNKLLSLVLGAGITIAIQSSSALTVMLVGLVNSGILSFGQTIGVLMGSNIGTTLTAWILSLAGLESSNLFLNLLKPKNFAPIFALAGVIMIMSGKTQKRKSIGNIAVGFAVLMYGMTLMSDTMAPLADIPEFSGLMTAFKNPILALLFGAVFTGIIQSSAASVGILQALSLTGEITYGIAVPIIMGQNIGTCVTALISSIGVSKNAKKVSVVHLSFNIIGTMVCLIPFLLVEAIAAPAFIDQPINALMIAVCHSIFNVITTFVLLPFTKQLEKLANFIIRDKENVSQPETNETVLLDDRLLTMPAFAVAKAISVSNEMAMAAQKSVCDATGLFTVWNEKTAADVDKMEDDIDHYEDILGTYLVKLSHTELSDADHRQVARMLHTINDLERLGDHAKNLIGVAEEIHNKGITFSPQAVAELKTLTEALHEILSLTVRSFVTKDLALAATVEPLEQVIDNLITEIKGRHILRLQHGNCTIELGFILTDLLTNYERISDHCSNIAVAIIEAEHDTYEAHTYLHNIKAEESGGYHDQFESYRKQFALEPKS
ncbi:MAG: Na/Pi cotransporter family protein [Oscillospiraceae bacterium]|nr:Na/Pi cotransporter family protein [Oscillospiraceae bacterium]